MLWINYESILITISEVMSIENDSQNSHFSTKMCTKEERDFVMILIQSRKKPKRKN